jgi:FAD/FMN-containing dehydrogenase
MAEIAVDTVSGLRKRFGGEVSLPGSSSYDEAVRIWNGAVTRRPAVVASCTTAEDVVAALEVARREGLELSVRGGGHNYAGNALCEGGMMIDLTPMKAVVVDVEAQRASCGGGTTWAELDAATQAHGLAVPGGFISHTGVAGLTLGGGIGWLSRLAGLSSDNLVGATVVTADGRVLKASQDENPDLFWAIRGGGGNFGVVTEFEFGLHRVGPLVHLGLFLFSPEQGRDLFRFAREFVRDLPDDSQIFLAGLNAPPEPFVPEELRLSPVFGLVVVGFGDAETHQRLIGPIQDSLSPIVELVTPIPYVDLQQMFDASAPWGLHSYEKAIYVDDLTDGVIDAIVEHQAKKMSPLSFVPIFNFGGAFRRVDEEATAFGGSRDTGYAINISATTPSPDEFDAERSWVRAYWSALLPHATGNGGYVNFMTEYDEDRVRNSYGAKYARLQQIKATFDPDNVFHLNPNITPA